MLHDKTWYAGHNGEAAFLLDTQNVRKGNSKRYKVTGNRSYFIPCQTKSSVSLPPDKTTMVFGKGKKRGEIKKKGFLTFRGGV